MIVETILSTINLEGTDNFAPMGIQTSDDGKVIVRPFRGSRTWDNLASGDFAAANITDSALSFVLSVVDPARLRTAPALRAPCSVLEDFCERLELKMTERNLDGPRGLCVFSVIHRETGRPFSGFNRARCAIVEALVAATRISVNGPAPFEHKYAAAVDLVERTGGPDEEKALLLLGRWTGGIA